MNPDRGLRRGRAPSCHRRRASQMRWPFLRQFLRLLLRPLLRQYERIVGERLAELDRQRLGLDRGAAGTEEHAEADV